MNHAKIHELLTKAGQDAEYAFLHNEGQQPHMRISRAGYPLVSTLLEDFIFSKLPTLPAVVYSANKENQRLVKRLMAQSTGYLFEQVVIDVLNKDPAISVQSQLKVDLGFIKGTCDIACFNESEKRITVVECKALKYGTKKECEQYALFADSTTSYTSQLAIYRRGFELAYPDYYISAAWVVFAKATGTMFKIPYTDDSYLDKVETAKTKAHLYSAFKQAFEVKDFDVCLKLLDLSTIPLKTPSRYGGYEASCPAHHNRWGVMLFSETGVVYDDACENLKLMLLYCLEPTEDKATHLLNSI